MFDFIVAKSYIKVRYEGTFYLENSYEELKKKMNDENSTITVKVTDFLGIGYDTKTFKKSEITEYGRN